MEVYLDTNILIAGVRPTEPTHSIVNKILAQTDIKFVTGFITILEFECVINALWTSGDLGVNEEVLELINPLSRYQQVKTITEFLLDGFSFEIVPVSAIDQLEIKRNELKIENTLTVAYNLAPNFPLKSLDVIQIASALKIKLYQNRLVKFFLTDDQQILKYSKEVHQKTGIQPVSSPDLSKILL